MEGRSGREKLKGGKEGDKKKTVPVFLFKEVISEESRKNLGREGTEKGKNYKWMEERK